MSQGTMEQEHLPILGGIGSVLRWLEELVALISGPLLTAGLAIALVDLLTDGRLLASQPALLFAWAVSQALGVDGQLVGASVKVGRAMRARRPWLAAAYLPLIGALGYVAYLASNVFATQQALGLTTQQALARLGMDDTTWIVARSLLAVSLVIISGLLRYDPAKQVDETAQERAEREARELAQARHQIEMRKLKAGGWRQTITAAIAHPTPGEAPDENLANAAAFGVDTGGEATGDADVKTGGTKARKVGQKAVPSDMMSAPQFRQYLAQSGVQLSPEKAVALVQSVEGSRMVGTAYCARKAPLMKLANRLIRSAQTTGNEEEEHAG